MRSRQAEDRGPTPGRYDDRPPKWLAPGDPSEHPPGFALLHAASPSTIYEKRALPCVRAVCCVSRDNREYSTSRSLSSAYLAASHKQKEKYPYPIKALRAGGGNTEYGVCTMHMHTRDSRDTR